MIGLTAWFYRLDTGVTTRTTHTYLGILAVATRMTTTTTTRGEKEERRSVSVARAEGRATSPVRSTRTPCQQVEARTDSLGADTYARSGRPYTYTYTPRSHAHSRPASCARARRKAHAHHAADQPARAEPSRAGEFLLRHRTAVTEPRLRPPSQPARHGRVFHSQYPSPSSCRTAPAASATHTRPNQRMYVRLPRSLTRPRSTERTTVPTTAESSRAEPSSQLRSRRGVGPRALRNSQPPVRAQTSTTTAT